ncbi:MAG: PAS domain S-box protein [Chthoniobacterales bacterium]
MTDRVSLTGRPFILRDAAGRYLAALGAVCAVAGGVYWFGIQPENLIPGLALFIALLTLAALARLSRMLRAEKIATGVRVAELEEAVQAQRESEARYREIVEISPDAVLVIRGGEIVYVNPATLQLLGAKDGSEIIGKTPADLVHPDERASVAQRTLDAVSGKRPLTAERRMIRMDGSEVEVESRVIPFVYEGKPASQVILRDITERRAAERKLRAAELKFRSIFDNAQEGIFQNTPEGVFLSANPALARMLGFSSPEDLIRERNDLGRQGYAKPEERAEFQRRLEREGVINNYEYEVKRKDGGRIWVSENVRIVRDAAGKTLYYEGSVQDITARKQSEEALRRSAERFRSFTEATALIVWQTDPGGRVLGDLPSWRAYTGQTAGELLGLGWVDAVHPQDRAQTLQHWEECRAEKKTFEMEYRLLRADGVYRLFAVRGVPVLEADGSIREWVGSNADITERQRAEEVLRESEQRFRFLNALSEASRALTKPADILRTVVNLVGEHLAVSRCSYAEMESDGEHFVIPHAFTAGCESRLGRFQLADFGPHARQKMIDGQTLVVSHVNNDAAFAGQTENYAALEIGALIACPLLRQGRLLAIMMVQQTAPRRWTDAEIVLVKEVAGRCRAIIERASAEFVLRENEQHLRLVIAASNDGIWECDLKNGALSCSERMHEMLGLDPETFTPTMDALAALVHPEDRYSLRDALNGPEKGDGRSEAHLRIRRPDGSYGQFPFRGLSVLDPEGRPMRVVGSISDLTHMLQAERKLVEQANLLNLAHDAIVVRDMTGRVEFWNHGAEVLYGWSAEEAAGRLSSELFEDADPETLRTAQATLIETGSWSGECEHSTHAGDSVTVRSRWSLLRDEEDKPKSALIINTDITEQKRIERQFLRAQRLESLGTLASGVAHDLNNVLLPIMMAAPVLRGEENPEERERFLEIVEASARRGSEIIKQVLTFARGADGERMLLQPIYLLDEVKKIASQTFPKLIAVRTDYAENIRLIEADPTQLHQVLLNLSINARDAMPHGGSLRLAVENFDVDPALASITPDASPGPHIVFKVEDNGDGIPAAVIDKIFDPFFTTKTIGTGTGLGLSTVAGIVRSHGGFIQVESTTGHTSFRIYLPAKEAAEAAYPLEHDAHVPPGHGQIVLVVDDEPSIREVAEVILTNHGYRVYTAEDGPAALAIFAQQIGQIGIVVVDLVMPMMSGRALVRALRRIDPQVKIMVSTGRMDELELSEVEALGVEGVLLKPYTTRNLLLKLGLYLRGLQPAA